MPRCGLFSCFRASWITFEAPQTEKERYREDSHGPCARMTRTNREVYYRILYNPIEFYRVL